MALLARSDEKLATLVNDLGDGAFAIGGDITNAESLGRSLATIEAKLGPIDMVVNNAGGLRSSTGGLSDRRGRARC